MRTRRLWSAGSVGVVLAASPAFSCSTNTDPGALFVAATVEFVQIEGGCWTLVGADGTVYLPIDLAGDYRVDGMKVSVLIEPVDDVATTCMLGEVVEVESIQPRA